MLRIRQVGSYAIPRYPQVVFKPWRRPAGLALAAKGAASAALLILLESCDGGTGVTGATGGTGVTGPPPMPPDFLTENEARVIITNVFTENGITLTPDVALSIIGSNGDTAGVVLDGYNNSLRVGYEYVCYNDEASFTDELIAQLEVDAAGSGPYIKATGRYAEKRADDLEQLMQAFIDTLKAHGKI